MMTGVGYYLAAVGEMQLVCGFADAPVAGYRLEGHQRP
jgi:hypothetical protein